MQFKQKLIKVGNSAAIIIPKEIKDLLGIETGAVLTLEPGVYNATILVSKEGAKKDVDPEFFEILKSVDNQYSKALKKLAEE